MSKMPTKTLKALKASIKHWERMRKDRTSEAPTSNSCPLCGLFNSETTDWWERCVGCPVFEFTNEELCSETPYETAHVAYYYANQSGDSPGSVAEWREAAAAEIKFLKSLLPK